MILRTSRSGKETYGWRNSYRQCSSRIVCSPILFSFFLEGIPSWELEVSSGNCVTYLGTKGTEFASEMGTQPRDN